MGHCLLIKVLLLKVKWVSLGQVGTRTMKFFWATQEEPAIIIFRLVQNVVCVGYYNRRIVTFLWTCTKNNKNVKDAVLRKTLIR